MPLSSRSHALERMDEDFVRQERLASTRIERVAVIAALLLIGRSLVADNTSLEEATEVVAERAVAGLRNSAIDKLSSAGLAESDVERISDELYTRIMECMSHTMEQRNKGNEVEAQQADDYLDQCIRDAFEGAGISFP